MSKKNGLSRVSKSFIIAGTIAIVAFFLAFNFVDVDWINEVRQEIFSMGAVFLVVGIVLAFFKTKLA